MRMSAKRKNSQRDSVRRSRRRLCSQLTLPSRQSLPTWKVSSSKAFADDGATTSVAKRPRTYRGGCS
jgi:hypothetical protein